MRQTDNGRELKAIRRDVGASGMPLELAPTRSYRARKVLGSDSIGLGLGLFIGLTYQSLISSSVKSISEQI